MTAKLQNLKAQFRQRRAAVEAGHGEMRDWKWYDRMADIMADGKDENSYNDFSKNDSRVATPPSMNPGNNYKNFQKRFQKEFQIKKKYTVFKKFKYPSFSKILYFCFKN